MNNKRVILLGGAFAVLVGGCVPGLWPTTQVGDAALRTLLAGHNVSVVVKPAANTAKVQLGQALFFDKLLSGNENISCATCHHPLLVTGDALSLAKGQGGAGLGPARDAIKDDAGDPILIPRNSPPVFDRSGLMTMFWDARVTDHGDGTFSSPAGDDLLPGLDNALAVQAMFPVTSGDEMRGSAGDNELADLAADDLHGIWSGLVTRILGIAEYRAMFMAAFPDVAEADLTFAHAANAIAAFEVEHWTLTDSPFDNYLRGDNSALSDSAKVGALLFYGAAGCADCHTGPRLTDESFHNRCVPQAGPGKGHGDDGTADFGREGVTGDPADRFKFRTPPLRNVAATGPWMHDGAFTTLEAAVRHELDPIASANGYDVGQLSSEVAAVYRPSQIMGIVAAAQAEGMVDAISLTDAQVANLIAFLESLSSPSLGNLSLMDIPESVPSGLPMGD